MSSRIGKTFVFSGLAIGAGAMMMPHDAHGATLAGWTFESLGTGGSTTSATLGPVAADVGTGSAFGQHTAATSAWSAPAGNGSLKSFSGNGWTTVGDNYEFRTSSVGATDLMIS